VWHPAGYYGTFRPPLLSSRAEDVTTAVTDVTVVPFDAVGSATNSAVFGMDANNGGGMVMTGDDPELTDVFHEYR